MSSDVHSIRLPRWSTPLVCMGAGLFVAFAFAFAIAKREGQPLAWGWLAGGAGAGLLTGMLV